ncbi:DUF6153 family protein [Streptomyces sp. NPDC000594]|uniref:DUF6153 family protein n=1 Tax=Streptomyces sp. NPDC000594 TaxID=3154261 RepID=UPI00332B505A
MARGTCGHTARRLLLLAALLLGLTSMHTMGHPSAEGTPAAHSAHAPTGHSGHSAPGPGGQDILEHSPGSPAEVRAGEGGSGGGHGMDPAMVCLAVLGALGAALLTLGAHGPRRRRTPAVRTRPSRAARGEGPRAPPPRTTLIRLSVLRT